MQMMGEPMIGSGALMADDAGALLRRVTIERFCAQATLQPTPSRSTPTPSTSPRPRPAGFTELIATAIAKQGLAELRRLAEEQAALRRVATLVARGPSPEEVFTAVAEEVGRLLDAEITILSRHEPPGEQVSVGVWSRTGESTPFPVGTRVPLAGRNVVSRAVEAGRPARIDDYTDATGTVADAARGYGLGSAVGVPIRVEDRLWGVIAVASRRERVLPQDTEARLADFTELVATAIANAEAQAAITASRARIVAAADQARQRIERDLHDSVQQRLVSLVIRARTAREMAPSGAVELLEQLDELVAEAGSALRELGELARGIHPGVLAEGGLRPALRALARRCAVPVRLDVRLEGRLPEPIETAVYYLVAETLTNVAKHAHASTVHVEVDTAADNAEVLQVRVRDDGRGGADLGGGSGLMGLKDRVEALGGRLQVQSPLGEGTSVLAELPWRPAGWRSNRPT
jgi:signal transduction histidine kinase